MNNLQVLGSLALVTMLLGGCAANDMLVKRQTESETKIEHLFQVAGGLEARLNRLTAGRRPLMINTVSRRNSYRNWSPMSRR